MIGKERSLWPLTYLAAKNMAKIYIRNSDAADVLDIYLWRNDSLTRSMSINSDLISYDEHIQWYKNSLANPNVVTYIGEIDGVKVGICRYEYSCEKLISKVSINLAPCMRGYGHSKCLLSSTLTEYLSVHNNARIIAEVLKNNVASISLFASCGFKKTGSNESIVFFEY